jgi:hypothetical protein
MGAYHGNRGTITISGGNQNPFGPKTIALLVSFNWRTEIQKVDVTTMNPAMNKLRYIPGMHHIMADVVGRIDITETAFNFSTLETYDQLPSTISLIHYAGAPNRYMSFSGYIYNIRASAAVGTALEFSAEFAEEGTTAVVVS